MSLNFELSEIMHLASQAIMSDSEDVKRIALADILQEVRHFLQRESTMDRLDRDLNPPLAEKVEAAAHTPRNYKRQRISYPEGLATTIEKEGRKLVGVIIKTEQANLDDDYPFKYYADVYENGDLLFSINSCTHGKAFMAHVLSDAMYGAAMQLTHVMRNRKNRKARRDAAKKGAI